jgi:hypothetical protein
MLACTFASCLFPSSLSSVEQSFLYHVLNMMLCALSDYGGQEEMVSENGMEVSFVEDSIAESGNESRLRGLLGDSSPVVILKRKAGVLIEERADSPIGGRLDLAEEVGGIIGLTCDGQEGLKRECFKRLS